MPIHTDYKEMARSMRKTYPGEGTDCRNFTDGSRLCMSKKAWSIFFRTGTKLYGKGFDTKPRPKKSKSVEETEQDELIKWYLKIMGIKNGV